MTAREGIGMFLWCLLIAALASCEKSLEPQVDSAGRPGQNQPGFVLIERIFDGVDESGLFAIEDERITPVSFREAYFAFDTEHSKEYVSIPSLIDWHRARVPSVPESLPLVTVLHGSLHIRDPRDRLVVWLERFIDSNTDVDSSSLIYSVAVLVELPE